MTLALTRPGTAARRPGPQAVRRPARPLPTGRRQDVAEVGELQALLGVLLDHDDGLALAVLEVVEDLEDHVDVARLQADGGLVDQQDLRPHHQGAADLQHPALAARQHPRGLAAALGQAIVFLEHLLGRFLGLVRVILEKAAHPQVLLDRHVGEHRVVLEDVGDAGGLQLFIRFQRGDVLAANADRAGENVGEAEDRVQDRGLAGPVRPDQAERLALANAQVEIVQDLHLAVAGAQLVDREEGLALDQRRQGLGGRRLGGDLGGLAGDRLDRHHHLDVAGVVAAGLFSRFAVCLVVGGHQCAPR